MKIKYIKTEHNEIIVFSELQQHSEFKMFNPVSAGFIDIYTAGDGEISCDCFGESVSLELKCNKDKDTKLAKRQILGYRI